MTLQGEYEPSAAAWVRKQVEEADDPVANETLRGQRRAAVLRKRSVTAAQLEKLSSELSRHPAHAKRLWLAIETRAMQAPQAKR